MLTADIIRSTQKNVQRLAYVKYFSYICSTDKDNTAIMETTEVAKAFRPRTDRKFVSGYEIIEAQCKFTQNEIIEIVRAFPGGERFAVTKNGNISVDTRRYDPEKDGRLKYINFYKDDEGRITIRAEMPDTSFMHGENATRAERIGGRKDQNGKMEYKFNTVLEAVRYYQRYRSRSKDKA